MKNRKKWITHEDLKADLMKDPEFKRAYEALQPEYEIACQIIEARIKNKMSQEELAKKAGTGQAVISRLEGMNARPSMSLLIRVARALQTKFTITIQ